MNKPIRYERIVDQLSQGEREQYALGNNGSVFVPGVKRPDVAGLIKYRPDLELWVEKRDDNLQVISGFVGLVEAGRGKTPTIFYDETGETLKNVPIRERVAFTAPQAFGKSEMGLEKDIAVLAEDVDRYLSKYKK